MLADPLADIRWINTPHLLRVEAGGSPMESKIRVGHDANVVAWNIANEDRACGYAMVHPCRTRGKGSNCGPLRIRMHDPRWLYSAQQHLRHAQRRHGFWRRTSLTKVTGERTLKPSLSASGSSIGNAAMKRGDEGVKPLAKDKVEATKSERLQTAPISNA